MSTLSLPIDHPLDLPATLTVVGPGLAEGSARLVRITSEHVDLASSQVSAEPGDRVIVTLDDRTRLVGRVLLAGEGGDLRLSRDGVRSNDDRSAPRVVAPLSVRYRVLPHRQVGDADAAWLTGGPEHGPFHTFAGAAEISVSGMLLPWDGRLPALGTCLLAELTLGASPPGSPASITPTLRVLGCVRRLDPIEAPVAVGVEFIEIDDEAAEEVSAFTLAHLLRAPV